MTKEPIETIPRDGTVVYVYSADDAMWTLATWDDDAGSLREWGFAPSAEPIEWATHWSSLGTRSNGVFGAVIAAVGVLIVGLMLAGCAAPPWGVVLLVPELVPAAAEHDTSPVFQLRHVGIDYPTREACVAVWGERCAEVVR